MVQQTSDILQVLVRRFWIIVLGFIIGGALGIFASQLMTPVYQSNVYLLVVPSSGNFGTQTPSDYEQKLRNDYTQAYSRIATDPAVIGESVRESGVGVDPSDIRKVVNVTPSSTAPILQVTVNFQDPEGASTLANAVARGLNSYTAKQSTDSGYRADVMAEATPPTSPVAPGWKLNIAVGAAVGLLVGGVVALLWESLQQAWKAWRDQRRARKKRKDQQSPKMDERETEAALEKVIEYLEKTAEHRPESRPGEP